MTNFKSILPIIALLVLNSCGVKGPINLIAGIGLL
jgi:predicted small lipoprotein YifL